MKKINILKSIIFILSISLLCISCNKDKVEKDNTGNNPSENPGGSGSTESFLGTYQLTMVTDSVSTDVDWISNEQNEIETGNAEPTRYGRLTITKGNTENTYNIVGKVQMGSNPSDSIEYYNTTATLDANGYLVMQPSTLMQNGYAFNIKYGRMNTNNPLHFRSEIHVDVQGYDCGYIMSNTASRQ